MSTSSSTCASSFVIACSRRCCAVTVDSRLPCGPWLAWRTRSASASSGMRPIASGVSIVSLPGPRSQSSSSALRHTAQSISVSPFDSRMRWSPGSSDARRAWSRVSCPSAEYMVTPSARRRAASNAFKPVARMIVLDSFDDQVGPSCPDPKRMISPIMASSAMPARLARRFSVRSNGLKPRSSLAMSVVSGRWLIAAVMCSVASSGSDERMAEPRRLATIRLRTVSKPSAMRRLTIGARRPVT